MEAQAKQTIDLSRLDDALFNQLYKDRIEPCFASNEEGRLAAVTEFKKRCLIGGAVVLLILAIAWMWSGDAGAGLAIGFIAAVFAGIIAYQPLAKIGRKLKQEYCAAIASVIRQHQFDQPFAPRTRAAYVHGILHLGLLLPGPRFCPESLHVGAPCLGPVSSVVQADGAC